MTQLRFIRARMRHDAGLIRSVSNVIGCVLTPRAAPVRTWHEPDGRTNEVDEFQSRQVPKTEPRLRASVEQARIDPAHLRSSVPRRLFRHVQLHVRLNLNFVVIAIFLKLNRETVCTCVRVRLNLIKI